MHLRVDYLVQRRRQVLHGDGSEGVVELVLGIGFGGRAAAALRAHVVAHPVDGGVAAQFSQIRAGEALGALGQLQDVDVAGDRFVF